MRKCCLRKALPGIFGSTNRYACAAYRFVQKPRITPRGSHPEVRSDRYASAVGTFHPRGARPVAALVKHHYWRSNSCPQTQDGVGLGAFTATSGKHISELTTKTPSWYAVNVLSLVDKCRHRREERKSRNT